MHASGLAAQDEHATPSRNATVLHHSEFVQAPHGHGRVCSIPAAASRKMIMKKKYAQDKY
jgi:hypothetical protein